MTENENDVVRAIFKKIDEKLEPISHLIFAVQLMIGGALNIFARLQGSNQEDVLALIDQMIEENKGELSAAKLMILRQFREIVQNPEGTDPLLVSQLIFGGQSEESTEDKDPRDQ